MSRPEPFTVADLLRPDRPTTLKVRAVAPLYGMSADALYSAIAAGAPLPFRVLRLGHRCLRIPTADVMESLGLDAGKPEHGSAE